jgi:hypothetical protein
MQRKKKKNGSFLSLTRLHSQARPKWTCPALLLFHSARRTDSVLLLRHVLSIVTLTALGSKDDNSSPHSGREAGCSLGEEPLSGPDGQWEGLGAASQLQAGLLPEVPRARPLGAFFFPSTGHFSSRSSPPG